MQSVERKQCCKCLDFKPRSSFHFDKASRDGRHHACVACRKARRKSRAGLPETPPRRALTFETARIFLASMGVDFDGQGWPGHDTLRYDDDSIAQAVVREFGPLTLNEVGILFGLTRQRVKQVEDSARRKLRALRRAG